MIYLGFILISMMHLLDLYYLKKRRKLNFTVFVLNFVVSMLIIIISFYYYFKYGIDKVDEYIIIITFLFSIVSYIKLNINKYIK